MSREILALRTEIEALKNLISRIAVSAPIEIVDAKKGYRLNLGKDNKR